jgi:hypothetical protein
MCEHGRQFEASSAAEELLRLGRGSYGTILVDPSWQFTNRTGRMAPGRRQVNIICSRKREHSRKPDQLYDIVEGCSPGPYLELFARHPRDGWVQWGDEVGREARHGAGPAASDRPVPLRLFQRPDGYAPRRTGG